MLYPEAERRITILSSERIVTSSRPSHRPAVVLFPAPEVPRKRIPRPSCETPQACARMPRCLILEPTRELAAQVADNFEVYGRYHKLSMALLIGGVSFDNQEQKLDRGVDVLIATPGRLLDHSERGKVILNDVQLSAGSVRLRTSSSTVTAVWSVSKS